MIITAEQEKLIESYLEGNVPYITACSLFLDLTYNKQYALRLLGNHCEQNEKNLHYELKTILESQPGYWQRYVSEEPTTPKQTTSSPLTPQKETFNAAFYIEPSEVVNEQPVHTLPSETFVPSSDIEAALIKTRNEHYRDRGHLHGGLHVAATDEERYEIAVKIMSTQKRIDTLNLEITNAKGGAIPVRFLRKELSADDLKNIQNIKRYISRVKKQLDSTDIGKTERYKLNVKLLEHETNLKKYV